MKSAEHRDKVDNNGELWVLEAEAEENGSATTKALPLSARLRGEIFRVVYSNPESHYAVLRLRDEQGREHTLVGDLNGVLEGQEIEASGAWERHEEHGRQFRVSEFRALLPSTEAGLSRYLASGVIPGIGPTCAERIVGHFGLETLHVLDNFSERLLEVPGIGRKRLQDIRKTWKERQNDRETRVFLQGLGISAAYADKIIRQFGAGAAEIVRRNPYRLADEINGIGFLTADRIAEQLGIGRNDRLRLCAGVLYTLQELSSQGGHTCCPLAQAADEASRLLQVTPDEALQGVQAAVATGKVAQVAYPDVNAGEPLLYLRPLLQAEKGLAAAAERLLRATAYNGPLPLAECLESGIVLNAAQRQGVEQAFRSCCSLITGGPGVGKTTVIATIVRVARRLRLKVALAAPTGRAAKRMSEATGHEAVTIHRLLLWDPAERGFVYGPDKPLPVNVLVVDEVSMLDVTLACNLFQAIASGTHLVLVGDRDQLPSVGPGAVLHALIECRRLPVTFLTEIYRQREGSRIILNAHAVNHGRLPDLAPVPKGVKADFYWLETDDADRAAADILRLAAERIPAAFGFNPLADVQVLTPMRKGSCGVLALNERLQQALNPPDAAGKTEVRQGSRCFRQGDRVMQVSNNYDKGVFNGEMGYVGGLDADKLLVHYAQGTVAYAPAELEQLVLAYAVTVHKSQGSEFPVVIMPVLTQHYVMLQRNLIYTGMTRARSLLIMLGSRRALAMAVNNCEQRQRLSLLAWRLAAPGGGVNAGPAAR